jgi:hypothetical protein
METKISSVHCNSSIKRYFFYHMPLFIDTENSSSGNNQHMFKFELNWLLRDGFTDMVKEVWNSVRDEADKMR